MKFTNSKIWWGPPKKFSAEHEERKISWLELFYDLVYVIAISKTTHLLANHPDFSGLLDYIYLFGLLFWGWYNGSMYSDLHGTEGVRNRFMTLWQMIILSAFIVTISDEAHINLVNATICLIIMQLYITYLWFSVGFYDKEHRKLNTPYTVCYLISLALLVATIFVEQPYKRIAFYVSLFVNYLPPFLIFVRSKEFDKRYSLTSSMAERLGLFTIIIFGETVLGVINGTAVLQKLSFGIWGNFALGIMIVFALWWLFFATIADRDAKVGFLKAHVISIIYAFTLMSLGIFASSFSKIFEDFNQVDDIHSIWIKNLFGISSALFLIGITLISKFMVYTEAYEKLRSKTEILLFLSAFIIMAITVFDLGLSLTLYLSIILIILVLMIIYITRNWFLIELEERKSEIL